MADLWHYTSEGKRMEPVTAGELRQLAGAGFLRREDLVWKQGMTEWAQASSIAGLFPKGAGAAAAFSAAPATEEDEAPATFETTPARRRRRAAAEDDDVEDEPRPRRRRRSEDDSPRRRRPAPSSGPSLALLLGLVGGGIFVLLVVVVAIVVAVARSGGIGNFTTTLASGQFQTRDFVFKANTAYEFVLTSNPGPGADVDIFLTDLNGQILRSGNFMAADNTIGPNGRIVWVFAVAGMHRVKVHNVGPQVNTSTVSIRELGPGHGIEVPPMMAVNPINMPMPFPKVQPMQPMQPMFGPPGPVGPPVALPDGRQQRKLPPLGTGQECEFTVIYPAAKRVTVEVRTIERFPDVDLFVFEIGSPRNFSDVTIGPDCNLSFDAQTGRSYRFVIRNVSGGANIANSTITYTSP